MKIWIINHYSRHENRHYFLAEHLINKGHEVTVIASSFDHKKLKDTHLPEGVAYSVEDVDGVPYMWLKTVSYSGNDYRRIINMLSFCQGLLKGYVSVLGKPDIIMGSSMHLFAGLGAQRLANSYQVPFVFEVRDLWPQSLIDLAGISRFHPVVFGLERLERYLYRKADHIITLLPDAKKHIVSKGTTEEKVTWIPNGFDVSSAGIPKRPVERETFSIIYAGSHGIANCLDSIIESAVILQNQNPGYYQFRFIGGGQEKQRLINRCQQEGINNVYFEDWVPRKKIYEVLAEADCLIVNLKDSPLYQWGISLNKLFDYMASARPVVMGANVQKNPINEARSGITVRPENAEEMAGAIAYLASMSIEERWQMGMRGRKYVEKNHDYVILAEKLNSIVEEILNS